LADSSRWTPLERQLVEGGDLKDDDGLVEVKREGLQLGLDNVGRVVRDKHVRL
jgi:hypothetical protein